MSLDGNRFADILDASAIQALQEMNLPRIYRWLDQDDPFRHHPDPFHRTTIADSIRASGINYVKRIPRSNREGGVLAPPFYGAQFVLNCGTKLRVTYDIDNWIDFDQLIAAFLTRDETPDSSRYHERLLIARHNIELNSRNVSKLEEARDARLKEVPYELHASIQARYREKIQDAEILNMQLTNAFNSAQSLYLQSIHLDAHQRESETVDEIKGQ